MVHGGTGLGLRNFPGRVRTFAITADIAKVSDALARSSGVGRGESPVCF
jgi:hypothetical protein